LVWARLGDVPNYIEPFAGSAAVLLRRPLEPGETRIETINDADCYVANFWRATASDDGQAALADHMVAYYADWPVSEVDLHARHRWLVLSEEAAEFRRRMRAEPDFYDVRIAGWWCWGLCCWIRGGWCTAFGETVDGDRKETQPSGHVRGVNRKAHEWLQMPHLADWNAQNKLNPAQWEQRPRLEGQGIHQASGPKRQLPDISGESGASGRGVNASGALSQKRPRVPWSAGGYMPGVVNGSAGKVTPQRRVKLSGEFSSGAGVHSNDRLGTCALRREWLLDWFGRLRDRTRTMRVCCGDWLRVCGSRSVTTRLGTTGVFFDPPYALNVARMLAWVRHLRGEGPEPEKRTGKRSRDDLLYASDSGADVDHLVARVHVYCAQRGGDPEMRIALCGYEGEHEALELLGWKVSAWRAHGGYGNRAVGGNVNADRERIWFSPHCLFNETHNAPLFAGFEPPAQPAKESTCQR
jgi:hypothetical protein